MAVIMAFTEPQDAPEMGVNSNVLIDTSTTRFRSAYSRCGFRCDTATTVYNITPASGLSEGWFGLVIGFPSSLDTLQDTNTDILSLRLNSAVPLLALRVTSTASSRHTYAWYNYADTSTNVFAASIVSGLGVVKIDINFRIHASTGFIRIYHDGVLIYSYSGNTALSSGANVNQFQVRRNSASTALRQFVYSELLFSDESTVGAKVITRPFTSFGAVNDWTGVIADINAASDLDTTFMSETTAGDILLMSSAAIPAMTAGEFISTVIHNFRANFEPSSPVTRIDPVVRVGGTNYFGTQKTLINTVAMYQEKWDTDPATGVAWLEAAVNSMQMGFRAAA